MYIQSERDLEDYICENIEEFKQFLRDEVFEGNDISSEINFIGRQVNVGGKFIDLLFDYWNEVPDGPGTFKIRTFIIVELKYRNLAPSDLAQLSRYMNILNEFQIEHEIDYKMSMKGVLLGLDLDENMQEIEMCLSDIFDGKKQDIHFVTMDTSVQFSITNYSHTDEFMQNLVFDNRLTDDQVDTD